MLNLNIQPNGEDISIDSLENYDNNQQDVDQFLEDEIGSIENLQDLEDNEDSNIKQNLKTKLESVLYTIKDKEDYYGIKIENKKYKIQKGVLLENLEKIIQNQTNSELNQLEVQLELKQLKQNIQKNESENIENKKESNESQEYNIENGEYYDILNNTNLEESLEKIIKEKNLETNASEMLKDMNRAWAKPFAALFDNIDNESTLANMSTGFNLGLMKFINKLPKEKQEAFLNQIYSGVDFTKAGDGVLGTLDKILAGSGLMFNKGGAINKTLKVQKLIEGINKAQNKYPNSNSKTNKYLHNPNEFANIVSDFLNDDQDSEYIENKISKEFGGNEIEINENDKLSMKQIANSFDNTVRNDVILETVQGVSAIPKVIDDTVGNLEDNLNGATNGFIEIFEKLERSSRFPEDMTKSLRESMEKFILMISEVINGFAGYPLIDIDQIVDEGTLITTRVNRGLKKYLENKDYLDSILKDFIIHDDIGISLDENEDEQNLDLENKKIKPNGQLSTTVSQNINNIIENDGKYENTNEYFEYILENDDEFKEYIQNNYKDIQSQLDDDNNKLFKKDGDEIVLNINFLSLAIKDYEGVQEIEETNNNIENTSNNIENDNIIENDINFNPDYNTLKQTPQGQKFSKYFEEIESIANDLDIPTGVRLQLLIKEGSKGNAYISPNSSSASGLGQITDGTRDDITNRISKRYKNKIKLPENWDRYNPIHQLIGSAIYLRSKFDTYNSWGKALITYNMGSFNIDNEKAEKFFRNNPSIRNFRNQVIGNNPKEEYIEAAKKYYLS